MRIIFDLDGVLVDVKDYAALYLAEKKDWRSYFTHTLDFKPIEPMVEIVRTFISGQGSHTIYFATGRPESNRDLTEIWLRGHIFRGLSWCNSVLLMRANNDSRSAVDLKLSYFKEAKPDLIFEDDPNVVKAALKEGYLVVQVHGYRYNRADLIPLVQEGS